MIKKYNINRLSDSTNFGSFYGGFSEKNIHGMVNTYEDQNQIVQRKKTRKDINSAINKANLKELREISKFFYTSNLSYVRFVEYFTNMLCYYWMVTPRIKRYGKTEKAIANEEIIVDKWWEVLDYIEKINPESTGPLIARKVLTEGACYIAVREKTSKKKVFGIQYLPIEYCRVRKRYLDRDVIDFNVKYFDEKFSTTEKKNEALESYPLCITEKYYEWKALSNKVSGSEWMTIDPDYGFRFTLRPDEVPFFIGITLDLLDVQDIKDISMYKLEQELSKIIVQTFGTTPDGLPIVDKDALEIFHDRTSRMLGSIPGIDVITTYADIHTEDLQSSQGDRSSDPTGKILSNVYNSAGISEKLFNADNAGTLVKSLIKDESLMYTLLKQFNSFLKTRISVNFEKGKVGKMLNFNITMPEISYINQADKIKLFKEQASLGYSKFLPAIAIGQRQSDIMSALFFENDVLDLISMMKPPASSNTVSSNTEPKKTKKEEPQTKGRPKKDETEVSEKTVKNRETI